MKVQLKLMGVININKLLALIEVKKIIALVLTGVFSYLALTGIIKADQFNSVFLIIIGFYFGQSTRRAGQIETIKGGD